MFTTRNKPVKLVLLLEQGLYAENEMKYAAQLPSNWCFIGCWS
jgi:hypothetical protein